MVWLCKEHEEYGARSDFGCKPSAVQCLKIEKGFLLRCSASGLMGSGLGV